MSWRHSKGLEDSEGNARAWIDDAGNLLIGNESYPTRFIGAEGDIQMLMIFIADHMNAIRPQKPPEDEG